MNKLRTTTAFLLIALASASYAQSFEETKELAEKGLASAQYNLGIMYDDGQGVTENDAEAVKWYRLAAEQGYVFAQYNLGFKYANGEGVPENDEEAVKWYRLAAEQGNAVAQFNLGNRYARGEGVPQNNIRAYVWWSVAATQGHGSARTYRDIFPATLTPEQLARGQALATRCLESHYQDCE